MTTESLIRNEKKNRALILLTAMFAASLITANLIGSKLVLLWGFTVSAGILVIPLTFLVCNLVVEIFGHETAKEVVWAGLFVQFLGLAFVKLGGALPPSPSRDLSQAYSAMYSLTTRMVIASVVAYLISQLSDVWIFRSIRARTGDKHFWLRKNAATIGGQAIDTAIFMAIFLGGVLPPFVLMKAMILPFSVKCLIAVFDTPFTYLGLRGLRVLVGQRPSGGARHD